MASVATLTLLIRLRDEASAQLGAIQGHVAGLGTTVDQASNGGQGILSKLFQNATNIASTIGLVQGVAGAVVGLAGSMVSGNAEFEAYEARFATLLGSTDAAKQKLRCVRCLMDFLGWKEAEQLIAQAYFQNNVGTLWRVWKTKYLASHPKKQSLSATQLGQEWKHTVETFSTYAEERVGCRYQPPQNGCLRCNLCLG